MNAMQDDLQSAHPLLRIVLLGINEPGQQAGNASTTNGRDLPWLQDVDADGNGRADIAHDLWGINFRDVVILDGSNTQVDVLNLNAHNLAEPANYATLREKLVDAAMQSQKPWTNPVSALDVSGDGRVVPLDVLLIVNVLNSAGPHRLAPPTAAQLPPPYYDTNGDGWVTALDALVVVNSLNAASAGGEGESLATGALDDARWAPAALPSPLPEPAAEADRPGWPVETTPAARATVDRDGEPAVAAARSDVGDRPLEQLSADRSADAVDLPVALWEWLESLDRWDVQATDIF